MPDLKVISLAKVGSGTNPNAYRPQPRAEIEMMTDPSGRFIDGPTFISGLSRAVQDLLKGLLTLKGTNFLAPNYGTGLNTLLHARLMSNVTPQINSDIRFLLGYLGKFNVNDDPSEQIQQLVSLNATQQIDTIKLDLTVSTGGGQTASITL